MNLEFPVFITLEVKGELIEVKINHLELNPNDESEINIQYEHDTNFTEEEIGTVLGDFIINGIKEAVEYLEKEKQEK